MSSDLHTTVVGLCTADIPTATALTHTATTAASEDSIPQVPPRYEVQSPVLRTLYQLQRLCDPLSVHAQPPFTPIPHRCQHPPSEPATMLQERNFALDAALNLLDLLFVQLPYIVNPLSPHSRCMRTQVPPHATNSLCL